MNPSDKNLYNIFFAVAGDDTTGTSGAFTVELELETGTTHCEEYLPGQSGLTAWPSNVNVHSLNAEGQYDGSGNLSSGACINLDFASDSNVACFPATQNDKFNGNVVFYALDELMPPNSVLTVTVDPAAGVDVSLFGLQTGTSNFFVPPYVPSGICESSLSYGLPNPNQPEYITFYNPTGNSYNILFGVAGADAATSGAYDINVALSVAQTHCPESLPGASYSSWPSTVKLVSLNGGTATVNGDLSQGQCVNLGFADDSSVACWPAPQNDTYEGNHVFYALDAPLPPNSELRIDVTQTGSSPVTVYGYTIGTHSYYVPPFVPTVVACEAPTIALPDGIILNTIANPFNVFFAVAGPEGATAGSYRLDLTLTP
jgi:hypothetical protein